MKQFYPVSASLALLILLFVWIFLSHLRIFNSFGDVTIADERLQLLTYIYAWHLWPVSSEGSLAYHTYCDTGHPFIMVISEDLWHSHLMLSVWQWSCHYLFCRPRSVAAGIWTPRLPLAGRTLKRTVYCYIVLFQNGPIWFLFWLILLNWNLL